jgi:peptide deformylase
MAVLEIVKYPHPVLKQEAKPIEKIDDRIRELAENMIETMRDAPGAGLAAPQVGESCRLIVLDASTEDEIKELAVINPEIITAEGEIVFNEACLSVIDYSANVTRANEVTVRGLDLDGNPIEIKAEERMAVVFQHEIDHLDGILFIDRISSLKRDLYKRRLKKLLKQQEKEAATG